MLRSPSILPAGLSDRLLAWYDGHRRTLPWRAGPGVAPDPYGVWLSEIMLQQTTVATVRSYFGDFLARWPTVGALANTPLDDVLHAWQGLGYYSRARNLHRCARIVSEQMGGRFPDHETALTRLPGIGEYTAAAVAAIAFDRPVVPVDGNVERVVSRMAALETGGMPLKKAVRDLCAGLVVEDRPGDVAQALMDLGATLCRPRAPLCGACPWSSDCRARKRGTQQRYPVRQPRKAKPTRFGVVFWLCRPDGAFWLRRRPETGLLGGMMEVPSTDWRLAAWDEAETRTVAPVAGSWRPLPGEVAHTFTHFHLRLSVWAGETTSEALSEELWCRPAEIGDHALPTVMKKVVRHAIDAVDRPAGDQSS